MSLILIELYKRWKTNDVREARVQTLRWALNEELRHGWSGDSVEDEATCFAPRPAAKRSVIRPAAIGPQ